jgi:hypothetical protein
MPMHYTLPKCYWKLNLPLHSFLSLSKKCSSWVGIFYNFSCFRDKHTVKDYTKKFRFFFFF